MQSKKFQRRIEDFVCEHCGKKVKGNGYTDHCPVCLWGRHVDMNPGDRAADCGGMMEPVRAEVKSGKYLLHYICKKCGHKYKVKTAKEDSLEEMVKIMSK